MSIGSFALFVNSTTNTAAALASFDVVERPGEARVVKVKTNDRLRALEILAKHLGLLREQSDHEHGGRIELVWAEDE